MNEKSSHGYTLPMYVPDMPKKRPPSAVTLYVQHLVAEGERADSMTGYHKVVTRHGRVSRPHLIAIRDGEKGVGGDVEQLFADMHFEGNVQRLREAAKAWLAEHPLGSLSAKPGAASAPLAEWLSLNLDHGFPPSAIAALAARLEATGEYMTSEQIEDMLSKLARAHELIGLEGERVSSRPPPPMPSFPADVASNDIAAEPTPPGGSTRTRLTRPERHKVGSPTQDVAGTHPRPKGLGPKKKPGGRGKS